MEALAGRVLCFFVLEAAEFVWGGIGVKVRILGGTSLPNSPHWAGA